MSNCLIDQNLESENILSNMLNDESIVETTKSKEKSLFEYLINKIKSLQILFQEKKVNYRNIFILLIILLFVICMINENWKSNKISVYNDNRFKIEIKEYNITYEIHKDSSMNVTENLTISFQGVDNTGFRRFIPVDNGVQIRNVKVSQIMNSFETKPVFHLVYTSLDNLVFDVGDYVNKYGQNESYSINYEFRILNKKVEKENSILLNVVGHSWNCEISNVSINLITPGEFTGAECFVGSYGTTNENKDFKVVEKNDKKIISLKIPHLKKYEGVTFYLNFTPNTIKRFVGSECTSYILMTLCVFLFIAAFAMNAMRKNKIVPVRYTFALNTLDPLIMSKVVNGDVRESDVPSIIFYWASKGFININFDDADNPVLMKNVDSIPDSYPSYQSYMFNELFKNGNVVETSPLKYKFYKTVRTVKQMVNSSTNTFVNNNSVVFSLALASLGSIFAIVAPLKIQKCISEKFDDVSSVIVLYCIFQVIIWLIRYDLTFKYIENANYYVEIGITAILCLISMFCYISNISSLIISQENKFALIFSSLLCVLFSPSVITKTAYFKTKINEVFGFKEFINHPVNEEFESFLEKDPELFYNFICYAQVLKLTDKWTHKFDNLTVSPPSWIIRSNYDMYRYNDYMWMYHRINHVNRRMVRNLVDSPPPENSHSSSHFSSSSHFGGGGFGGGGGCGR